MRQTKGTVFGGPCFGVLRIARGEPHQLINWEAVGFYLIIEDIKRNKFTHYE